jgi:hypothetical protein
MNAVMNPFIRKVSRKHAWISGWIVLAATAYIVPYFLCSEVYHGQWEERPIKFRVFQSPFDLELWFPLLKLEEFATPTEFEGHVASGASLPPPDTAYYQ